MSLIEKIIVKYCTLFNVNLLRLAYNGIGISSENEVLSTSFFEVMLPKFIKKNKELIFFDVGANVGEVTKLMLKAYDKVNVHSFEPNPFTFENFKRNVKDERVVANNIGLGEKNTDSNIFFYGNDKASGHASIYKEVFDLHKATSVEEHPIKLYTLDYYCELKNIQHIDFLKIDTEGHELFVLKGAEKMLRQGDISVIQFEFNEMNIISRVFLKDFYDLLIDYEFYRIKGDALFPLGPYASSNEIFRLQNLIAIRKK